MRSRSLAAATVAAALLLAAALVCVAVAPLRTKLLQAVGHALVVDSRATPSDVIVVAVAGGSAVALEVADLVHDGIARRVAVVGDPPDPIAVEFARRGVPYDLTSDAMVKGLRALGVQVPIERIDTAVAGTEDFGAVLPRWCAGRDIRSALVVTTRDHSRRTTRVLRRASRDGTTRFVVVGARYSTFDPRTWWHSRTGLRTAVIEGQKLLLDIARHPLS